MTEAEYLAQLLALLPPGPAWSAEVGQPLHDLLRGWAVSLSKAEARFRALIEEADPRTTSALLSDWERVAGLPDDCVIAFGGEQTEPQRRMALVARLISKGGMSRAYYLSVIEALGYTASITEFHETTVDDDVDVELVGEAWAAAWQVNLPLNSITEIDVSDDVDTPLATWGDALLECVLNQINRAGAVLVFNYS